MSNVTVRASRASELGSLAAWNAQLIRDEGNDTGLALRHIEARLREWLAADYRASVFEVGGTPFGYAIHREMADCTHLRHFFVESAYRRRGLGRRAFELLRSNVFAEDRRILVEALVGNAGGLAFWQGVGFTQRYIGMQLVPAKHPQ